jgi:hypothetical protein
MAAFALVIMVPFQLIGAIKVGEEAKSTYQLSFKCFLKGRNNNKYQGDSRNHQGLLWEPIFK